MGLFGTFKVILLTNTEITSNYFYLSAPPLVIALKESEFEWVDFQDIFTIRLLNEISHL